MRINDQQLGKPETIYKDTKTNIEAMSAVEGMIVYASDTDQFGVYNGITWDWFIVGGTTDSDAIHDNVSGEIAAITEKITPVDADVTLIEDSASTNAKKKISWSNIKTALKTYFDTLYAVVSHTHDALYAPIAKGVTNGDTHDHSGGDGAQINHTGLSNIGTNTHAQVDTFIASKAAASGLASLDASSKVVQNPANATATPTASKIPIADANAKLNGWVSRWIYASDADWVGTQYAPLTSTSWDGDSFSTVSSSTQLDLSAVFGVPANVKAVLLYCEIRDSGSAAGAAYFACGPSTTYYTAGVTRCGGLTNDISNSQTMEVPCDDNGDVWYRILATGASTADIWLRVWGYYL